MSTYSKALDQLRREQDFYGYPEDEHANMVIAKEVGGALAEGFGDKIDFGTFDNCREWGLTFTAGNWQFCCYEHRNSDDIHIEGCKLENRQTWGPYGGTDKYRTLFRTSYGDYQAVTAALAAVLRVALIPGPGGILLNRATVMALMGGAR